MQTPPVSARPMPIPAARTSHDVCGLAGCSYRQLDWWVRTGVLTPSVSPAAGSGTARRWSDTDVTLVRVVTRLAYLGAAHPVLIRAVESLAPRGSTALAAAHHVLVIPDPWRCVLDGNADGEPAYVIPLH